MITEAIIVCVKPTSTGVKIFKVGKINNNPNIPDEGPGLNYYRVRQRYSNERFYAIGLENYNNESTREYIFDLIRNGMSSNLYTYI